jgi:hypothetical protein
MKTPQHSIRTTRRADAEGGISLAKRRAWHDEAGAADAADSTTAQTTTMQAAEDKKFSQADMDRVQGKTRKEAKQAALDEFIKELGFEKPDDLKTLITAAKQRDEAEKTEAQKAADTALKEKERADKAEKALAERNAEIDAEKRAERLNAAVKDALTAANAKADKVLKLLKADAPDALEALLKEDGTVDKDKLSKLVESARKSYPEDFGKGGVGSPSNSGGRGVDPGKTDRETAARSTLNALRNRI